MLVSTHNGCVDHHVFVVVIARQQLEDALENPALRPPTEALVDDFPIPETLGEITPRNAGSVIVDAVREVRPPFSPSAVVDDFAVLLKSYRVSKIIGDHYGGEFVKEPFRKNGISYELCKQPKSDLFRDMLPLLNSGRISLPRLDQLIAQIVGLERRVSRAGRGSAWMNLIWD
jgi:hypothetical protein